VESGGYSLRTSSVLCDGYVIRTRGGKKDSHAIRLDAEAVDTILKARLNRKMATSIFFESNGGQARAEATIPEIRLAVAEPALDVGNVETVIRWPEIIYWRCL
jgi:hypothetical protein